MPLDINFIRKNPDKVKESELKRFRDPNIVDEILTLDEQWKSKAGELDLLRKEKNKNQKEIANYYKSKQQDLALELKDKNTLLNDEIINTEENKDNMFNEINKLVNKIGNIIAPDVIVSKDEERDNNVIKTWGNKILKTKEMLNHHILLDKIGGIEFERGIKTY
jgi:seryl-tRNA synthetase